MNHTTLLFSNAILFALIFLCNSNSFRARYIDEYSIIKTEAGKTTNSVDLLSPKIAVCKITFPNEDTTEGVVWRARADHYSPTGYNYHAFCRVQNGRKTFISFEEHKKISEIEFTADTDDYYLFARNVPVEINEKREGSKFVFSDSIKIARSMCYEDEIFGRTCAGYESIDLKSIAKFEFVNNPSGKWLKMIADAEERIQEIEMQQDWEDYPGISWYHKEFPGSKAKN